MGNRLRLWLAALLVVALLGAPGALAPQETVAATAVYAWGTNSGGELGDGGACGSICATPQPVPGLPDVDAISVGGFHSLALADDGTVWAWGWDEHGQVGDGTTGDPACTCRPVPVHLAAPTGVAAIAASADHSGALLGTADPPDPSPSPSPSPNPSPSLSPSPSPEPSGGTITGTVYANGTAPGNGVAGATVYVCSSTICRETTTDGAGHYTVGDLPPGTYTVSATGPLAQQPATIGTVVVSGTGTTAAPDLVLTTPRPIPPGTTITNISINNGIPNIYWNAPLTLTTGGCPGGAATYQLAQGATIVASGALAEGPSGTYTATIAPLKPALGDAHLTIAIACPGGGGTTTIAFDLYIDPSGTVRTTGGLPIAGATVTLYRATAANGPFAVVPHGSAIMAPMNRTNPSTADAAGHFGWDVVAGFYKVRAEQAGCTAHGNPAQAFVESAVLPIPPPVTDLDLRLDCGASPLTVPPVPAAQGSVTVARSGDAAILTATPAQGQLFLGWQIGGAAVASWANPLTLTLTGATTVTPVFAARPAFGDLPPGSAAEAAIANLAARGVINGCDKDAKPLPLFCPDGPTGLTLRHQMAALIVRAIPGWADETGLPTFSDNTEDLELMTRVATVQRHNVAQGYQPEVCQAQGKTPPCYGPLDTVKYGQTLLFIARAMVAKGYWTLQPDDRTIFTDQNGPAGADPNTDRQTLDHRMVVTYVHYVGTPPDGPSANAPFAVITPSAVKGWGDDAPRAWFARALWPALDKYFGTDEPGSGGYAP